MNLKLEEFTAILKLSLYCILNTPFQIFCVTLQTPIISDTNFVQFFDAALLMKSCKWHYFKQFRLKDSNLHVKLNTNVWYFSTALNVEIECVTDKMVILSWYLKFKICHVTLS